MNGSQAKITHYIERNLSPELGAISEIDFTPPAGTDLLDGPVGPD